MAQISPPASNLLFLPTNIPNTLVPTNVVNAVTGQASSLNNFSSPIVGNIPVVPQYFFSIPFANNQSVLYKMSIVVNGIPGTIVPDFIFPLTPNNIQKQSISLTNYYDVSGPANSINIGVQRIIDIYGLTPPIITISGTTGFQFHSLDQFQWSGKASFALLVQFIQTYIYAATAAATSSQATNVPQLQFTDGYTGEVFTLVPLNQQLYTQDSSRPIYQTYNLQFLATASVTQVPVGLEEQDLLVQAFITARALQVAGLLSWWNSLLSALPGTIV
jgi:hypothetical protein